VGYARAEWESFAGGLAAVAGALTGLVFIAVSVRVDTLSRSLTLRARAAQTLVLLTTSAVVALIVLAPQPDGALGGELIGWAILSGVLMAVLAHRASRHSDHSVERFIEQFSPNLTTPVLVAIAGISFLAKAGGGLYWLLPIAAASLLGGLTNAWLFLIRDA
jgi:modulator of FtsH protease